MSQFIKLVSNGTTKYCPFCQCQFFLAGKKGLQSCSGCGMVYKDGIQRGYTIGTRSEEIAKDIKELQTNPAAKNGESE